MPKTYNELYLETRRIFKEQGISGYNLEARLLVAFAAGKSVDRLLRERELYTSDDIAERVEELVGRRLEGEPVAYITGSWEFYGISLTVGPGVLIPRMDTELLADAAIRALVSGSGDARVLDLGAGSGCIALAIALKLPKSRVVLVDNSERALFYCRKNLSAYGLMPRAVVVSANALEEPPSMLGSFDLAVCNPPYIRTDDIRDLDVSVRDYEPHSALDGGEDGLKFYRAILDKWKRVIREGGMLLFEAGAGQAEDIKKLMRLSGFKSVEGITDTGGVERVISGRA